MTVFTHINNLSQNFKSSNLWVINYIRCSSKQDREFLTTNLLHHNCGLLTCRKVIASQSVHLNLVYTDHIRMQLAAVVQRCKRIEREATKKAEACFKEQEKRFENTVGRVSATSHRGRKREEVSSGVIRSS